MTNARVHDTVGGIHLSSHPMSRADQIHHVWHNLVCDR